MGSVDLQVLCWLTQAQLCRDSATGLLTLPDVASVEVYHLRWGRIGRLESTEFPKPPLPPPVR